MRMLSARTQIRVEWQRYEIEEEVCAWDGSAGGEEVPLPLHKKNRSRSDPFLKYAFFLGQCAPHAHTPSYGCTVRTSQTVLACTWFLVSLFTKKKSNGVGKNDTWFCPSPRTPPPRTKTGIEVYLSAHCYAHGASMVRTSSHHLSTTASASGILPYLSSPYGSNSSSSIDLVLRTELVRAGTRASKENEMRSTIGVSL